MMKYITKGFVLLILFILITALPGSALGAVVPEVGDTERVSLRSDGGESDGSSYSPSISADGRYVAFQSYARNLVDGDTNSSEDFYFNDIFVYDRNTNTVERVSVASDGTQAELDSNSEIPDISADGRYVAFTSDASNLVAGDTNGVIDVFIHDRQTHATWRVSVGLGGAETDYDSNGPHFSGDGQYLAFASEATNLVANDTNNAEDVFVYNMTSGAITRVSVASGGVQGNGASSKASMSNDGNLVAFTSFATNLVAGDANGRQDIFVHNRTTGDNTIVSVASDGTQGNYDSFGGVISGNGNFVAFTSEAGTLTAGCSNYQLYLRDLTNNTTTCVSVDATGHQGYDESYPPTISSNGKYVAYASSASNIVNGDDNGKIDIFVYDTDSGETRLASITLNGTQGNAHSQEAKISADGQFVAYDSGANNLVANDSNESLDVFVTALNAQPAEDNSPTSLAPADGTLVKAGKTTLTLKWKLPTGKKAKDIRQYQLQVATSTAFAAPLFYDKAGKPAKATVKNLLPNTTYYWRVRAIFKIGTPPEGSWSTTMSFSTVKTAAPKLTGPKNNRLQKKANFKLTWKRPTGAPKNTVFVLQVSEVNDFSTSAIGGDAQVIGTKYAFNATRQ